jgi:hypothetical protein
MTQLDEMDDGWFEFKPTEDRESWHDELYDAWHTEGESGDFAPFFGCAEETNDDTAAVPNKLVRDYRSAASIIGLLAIEVIMNTCLYLAIIAPLN